MSRRAWLILALALMLIGFIIAMVVLGRINGDTYFLRCGERHMVAEKGRGFPPWGQSALSGEAWKPIAIPLGMECQNREVAELEELREVYRQAMLDLADAWLTRERPRGEGGERIGEIQAQLEQALLLSRSASQETRNRIQRYLADVEYWRSRDQIEAARRELVAASKRLQSAWRHDARYSNTDAARWQALIDSITTMLERGPDAAAGATRPGTPPGQESGQTSKQIPGQTSNRASGQTPARTSNQTPGQTPDPIRDQPAPPAAGQPPGTEPPDTSKSKPDVAPGVLLPLPADAMPPTPDAGVPAGGTMT